MTLSVSSTVGARKHVFHFGGLFIDEMVQRKPWGDALQQADSNAAIESFWRWKFEETWPL